MISETPPALSAQAANQMLALPMTTHFTENRYCRSLNSALLVLRFAEIALDCNQPPMSLGRAANHGPIAIARVH
jgi:hypothetical protein